MLLTEALDRDIGIGAGARRADGRLADDERSAAGEQREAVRDVARPRDLQRDELRGEPGGRGAQVEAQAREIGERVDAVEPGGGRGASYQLDRRVRERHALRVGHAPGDRRGGALHGERHRAGVHGRARREDEALARAVIAGEGVDRRVALRRENQVERAITHAAAGGGAVQHDGDAGKRRPGPGDHHAADEPAGRRRGLLIGIERRREIERGAACEGGGAARELIAEEARGDGDGSRRHRRELEAAEDIRRRAERRGAGDGNEHARQRNAAGRRGHSAAHDACGRDLRERDPSGVQRLACKQRVRGRRTVVAGARHLRRIRSGGEPARAEPAVAVREYARRAGAAQRDGRAGERQVGRLVDHLAGERSGGRRGGAGAERAQCDRGQKRIVLPTAGRTLPADEECARRRTPRGVARRGRDRDQRDRREMHVALPAAVGRLPLQHPREQGSHRGGGAAVADRLQRKERERAVLDARQVVRRADAAVGLHARHQVGARIARDRPRALAGARQREHRPRRVERITFETGAAAEAAVGIAAQEQQVDLGRGVATRSDQRDRLPRQVLRVRVGLRRDGVGEAWRHARQRRQRLRGFAAILQRRRDRRRFVRQAAIRLHLALQPAQAARHLGRHSLRAGGDSGERDKGNNACEDERIPAARQQDIHQSSPLRRFLFLPRVY